ncbi:MAG: hypothetical protein E7254_12180 [Lachnospiraceae bacterium]|nr:hypothetical protein [Lachnospiraceae bacterium]
MKKQKLIKVLIVLLGICLSFFLLANRLTTYEHHEKTINALEDKKNTVLELTGAATASSAAITLLPGDTATPIAEQLADMTSYFLIAICAIYLEKYLLTITGVAAFKWIIPIAGIVLILAIVKDKEQLKLLTKKVIMLAIAIYLVVPTSVYISNLIENTYKASIQQTIDKAKDAVNEIETEKEEEKDGLEGVISKVKDTVSKATVKFEEVLNKFIEALAVILVTSCIIPVFVLLFYIWLFKLILGVEIDIPRIDRKKGRILRG